MEEYKLLDKNSNYNADAARQFASAVAEVNHLKERIEFLTNLIKDNQELARYCWTSLDGRTQAICDIEDSHLVNIARHIASDGRRKNNPVVDAEIAKRGLTVPSPKLIQSPPIDDIELEDDDMENHPELW